MRVRQRLSGIATVLIDTGDTGEEGRRELMTTGSCTARLIVALQNIG